MLPKNRTLNNKNSCQNISSSSSSSSSFLAKPAWALSFKKLHHSEDYRHLDGRDLKDSRVGTVAMQVVPVSSVCCREGKVTVLSLVVGKWIDRKVDGYFSLLLDTLYPRTLLRKSKTTKF